MPSMSRTYNDYFSDRPIYRNPLPSYLQRGEIDLRGLQGYSADYIPQYTGPELVPTAPKRIFVPRGKTLNSIMEAALNGLKSDLSDPASERFVGVGIAARFITALEPVSWEWSSDHLAPSSESRVISITKQPGHHSVVAYEQGVFVSATRTAYRKDDNFKYGPLLHEPQRLPSIPFDELNQFASLYKIN